MRPRAIQLRAAMLSMAWLLFWPAGADAQYPVNIERMPPAMRNFEWRPDDKPLNCYLSPLKPGLNFGFRFQAGYIVRVPMSQYRGTGHRWTVLMRITPEAGKPVYLVSRYRLPEPSAGARRSAFAQLGHVVVI